MILRNSQEPRPIFKNRPGLAAFLAVIIGIALADKLRIEWSIAVYFLVGSLLVLPGIVLIKIQVLRNLIGLLICVSLGLSLYSFAIHDQESAPLARFAENAGRCKVTGVVTQIDEIRQGQLLIVSVSEVVQDSLRVNVEGNLAVTLGEPKEDASVPLPLVGDSITVYADIFPLRLQRNPYASSYDERLKYHYGAHATADLNSRFDYNVTPTQDQSILGQVALFFARVKTSCDRILAASIKDTEASAFVRAVVLGTRSDIPESTVLDFKYSGLTHLLAISGFNIALVGALVAQGLLLLGIRRRVIRLPITAMTVAFYCLVVGLEPSVLRAFVMVELYILALLLERKSDLANIAALTALVHIVIDPFVVHDAGFQLSYAAVFGFALVQPHLTRLFERPQDEREYGDALQWLQHSVILSVAAFIATTPVLLFHFRQTSVVVLLANLVAIPIAAVITTLGFILLPLGLLLPQAAQVHGDAIAWSVQLLTTCSSLLASMTGGGWVINLNIWMILLGSAVTLWVLQVRTRRAFTKRLIGVCCSLLLVTLFIPTSTGSLLPQNELTVVFADVGQGDATIVRTPSGKCYMFDFGPLNGSDLNFSARPYASILQVEGIDRMEAGFITHLHRDHYGSAFSAAFSDKVNTIYTVGDRTSDEFAYSLDSIVRTKEIAVRTLNTGETIELDQGVKLYVLGPDSTGRVDHINNDRSLVLKIVYGSSSILLLGDIEQQAEKELVSRYGEFVRSDVVKVAHHGSISSSTSELVHAASPKYAVISCGRNNRFGHPHRKVVSRWLRRGAEVLRTDLSGAILFSTNGTRLHQLDWKD
jgi:competence protein ComEC